MTNLWLYLARRDSKGIRVLTVLRGRNQPALRITDMSVLQLPSSWEAEIRQIVEDNRLQWELFIESADDYDTLRQNLKNRGYTSLPLNNQPEFIRNDINDAPEINVARLPKQYSMLRRGGA
jgi:hypothetical protein